MNWPQTLLELQQQSDDELRRLIGELPSAASQGPGGLTSSTPYPVTSDMAVAELERRNSGAHAREMSALAKKTDDRTKAVVNLTWAIAGMTLVSTVFVVLSAVGAI